MEEGEQDKGDKKFMCEGGLAVSSRMAREGGEDFTSKGISVSRPRRVEE